MNSPNLSGLYDILEEERKCCARLLKVSREEQQSLVDNDLKQLGERTQEMQSAVRELHGLHLRRKAVLENIGRNLNMSLEDISFNAVIEKLNDRAARALKNKLSQLMRIGEALYRVNQQTIYLINFSMGVVDQQVDLWADILNQAEGYEETGASKKGGGKAKIIEGKV